MFQNNKQLERLGSGLDRKTVLTIKIFRAYVPTLPV